VLPEVAANYYGYKGTAENGSLEINRWGRWRFLSYLLIQFLFFFLAGALHRRA